MAPAVKTAGPQGGLSWADYITRLEQANVANSLDNLRTFPRLRHLIDGGQLAVHGAYFGVAAGELLMRDEITGVFVPVAARTDGA
jgi:carbonic anhydrase